MTLTETDQTTGTSERTLTDASRDAVAMPSATTDAGPTGMRVTKRNGAARAGRPQQDRQRDRPSLRRPPRRRSDACRHPHHLGARRRRHHRRTRQPVDPHRSRTDRGRAELLQARLTPPRCRHRQRSPQPEHPVVLRVDQGRLTPKASSASEVFDFVEANAPELNAAINSDRDRQLRVLRPAHGVRPLPAAPPRTPRRHRDAAVLLPPRRLRPRGSDSRRSGQVLRPDVVARLPAVEPHAVQLGHHTQPDVELLPARLARGQPRRHLQALHRHRQAVEVRRRHRRRMAPHPLQGQPDHRHQRSVQRHRPVAAHARLVGRRGQPGRSPQGRCVCLPRVVARRHRGLPRTARQHRRPRSPHAQPEHRQLDPRPLHGARREGLAVEPVRPEEGRRSSPTCTATTSSEPTSPPRSRSSSRSRSRPASCTPR